GAGGRRRGRRVMPLADAPPLQPDAEDARRQLLDELAGSEYLQAQPSWFDRFAAWLRDLLGALVSGTSGGSPGLGALVLLGLLLAVLVAAVLLFGRPRLGRRSALAGAAGPLFGAQDDRDSERMRRAAAAAAAAGDLGLAVAELFRAIARSAAERGVVDVFPGTTAQGFAARAGRAVPTAATLLAASARDFDAVRYLGRAGSAEQYRRMQRTDAAMSDGAHNTAKAASDGARSTAKAASDGPNRTADAVRDRR
ncbi:MAG: DUF4129 domain-containing protein, partial [Microbacteriaceae bacterium]